MTLFRPCIDLHAGVVKQIVGGTLNTQQPQTLQTNFTAEHPAEWYASLYRQHGLRGGHVILLGEGNQEAAQRALAAWPNGLQVGGGITDANALQWLDEYHAEKVIVTSWLFPDGQFSLERLVCLSKLVGKHRLVVDVSCRRKGDRQWVIAIHRWQTLADLEVNQETISLLSEYCSEILVHAADVEGLCQGIDEDLVACLGTWCHAVHSNATTGADKFRCTYAGGGRNLQDLALVHQLSAGYVDLTIGSALDIFGGNGVTLQECIEWNHQHQ